VIVARSIGTATRASRRAESATLPTVASQRVCGSAPISPAAERAAYGPAPVGVLATNCTASFATASSGTPLEFSRADHRPGETRPAPRATSRDLTAAADGGPPMMWSSATIGARRRVYLPTSRRHGGGSAVMSRRPYVTQADPRSHLRRGLVAVGGRQADRVGHGAFRTPPMTGRYGARPAKGTRCP